MRLLTACFLIIFLTYCTQEATTELDFLAGTWKAENKEQYEVWEKKNPSLFEGYSYKMEDGQQKITETLTIRKVNGRFVYEATVPDQNEGQTISFVQNQAFDSLFSFENDEHDFPKKIQYQKIEDDKIKVTVLGEDDQGFSYHQIKTE